MVHGHVRVLLNFATFPLIVLIKLLRIFFSKLALLLIINRLLKKGTVTHDYVMFFLRFLQEHISANREYILIILFPHVCFLLFCKFLSKEYCLNIIIFPVTVVKILRHIQNVFSFRVQPIRTKTITTVELLSILFRHVTLTICFDRFD